MKNKMIPIIAAMLIVISCSPDCIDSKSSYNNGYSSGKIADGYSCSSWASAMGDQGLNVNANDCYCAGFNDAKAGKENKYKED